MAHIVLAVLASLTWMLTSSLLILVNNHLMNTAGFHFPMALAALGMACSSAGAFAACRVLKLVHATQKVPPALFLRSILPVGLCMAGTLYFGNVVYLYLTVAFIQMFKAFTPVLTMLCLFAARLETPSRRLVLAVLVIALGTVVATYGELNFNLVGLLAMMTSGLLESIRLVMTQHLMAGLKFQPMESLMYLAPTCCLCLLLGAYLHEFPTMQAEGVFPRMANHPLLYATAACMGFAVNVSAFFTIKLTSSLTLKILGTVKNACVVLYSMLVLGEAVTLLQAGGYSIGVAGFLWYTRIQQARRRAKLPDGQTQLVASSHANAGEDKQDDRAYLLP